MYNLFFIFLILILCSFKIIITANGTIMENNDILQQEETFQIVRSIRATIITPRLKTTEHIFAANTDYNIAVSIRKAILNVNITLFSAYSACSILLIPALQAGTFAILRSLQIKFIA